MTTVTAEKLYKIFVVCGFVFFVVVLISLIAEATTDAQVQRPEIKNNNIVVTTQQQQKIDEVIKAGVNECSNLETGSCLGVMYTLDNICQVAYFPSCFGADKWNGFMNHLQYRIQSGDYPDKGYEDDPYLTLNNHHFGDDGLSE